MGAADLERVGVENPPRGEGAREQRYGQSALEGGGYGGQDQGQKNDSREEPGDHVDGFFPEAPVRYHAP